MSASTSKSIIDAQDNIVTPDKVGVTVESVNNSIRNTIGRSYSFGDFKRQEKRCCSKDWNEHNTNKQYNLFDDAYVSIDVAHSASTSDEVNDTSIVDINFSFNIQEYFYSNPILVKNYDSIFNEGFQKLYEFAIGTNSILPDFVEMENIKFVIKITQTVFYARNRTEYDYIYEQSLHVNRQILPNTI